MVSFPLRIATRRSPLALAQAGHVADMLADALGIPTDERATCFPLIPFVTTGDRVLNPSLADIGGKGLFTKEIELALLNGDADIAVHSMKDMPAEMPSGLVLAAVPEREAPNDAFVTLDGTDLLAMPEGATIGTSSIRRTAQTRRLRPDLSIVPFRGNIGTRLAKLANGDARGTFLAEAGLRRLGRNDVRRRPVNPDDMLPALGQGTLCLQARAGDTETLQAAALVDHQETSLANAAERAFIEALDGSCRTPIAGLATVQSDVIVLRGEILLPDGSRSLKGERLIPVQGLTHARMRKNAGEAGRALARGLAEEAGPDFLKLLKQ